MGRGADLVYNMVSLFFVMATLVVVVVVGVVLLQAPDEGDALALLPTVAPTRTPTDTPIPTLTDTATPTGLPPTFTPTPTNTLTPTITPTLTSTITPSPTLTDTPSVTPTPAASDTPTLTPTFTLTPSPTGPTPTFTPSVSPFLFDLRDAITYRANFANTAGCNWQGIGGQVLALDGTPFQGNLQVRAFNSQTDRVVPIGSNSLYGEGSGWEITVDVRVNSQLYFVQLESIGGTQLSPRIQVQFNSNCDFNTAIVNFIQTRPAS